MKLAAVLAALLTLVLAPAAQAETLTLDLNSSARPKSQAKLVWRDWYVVTVRGTGSFHAPAVWAKPTRIWKNPGKKQAVICGTPELAPMFTAPGMKSGPAGFDAETLFARPVAATTCADEPGPRPTRRFEISDGNYWFHQTPLTGRYVTPRADHTYAYAIHGENNKLTFRVKDSPVADNYGRFEIDIRPALKSDCRNRQWRNFLYAWGGDGFTNEADCVAAMKHDL